MFPQYFLFLIILIKEIYTYIVLPLQLLPKENYKAYYDLDSQNDIMSKEVISSYFTELEIGTPRIKIPVLVKPKINDYVITSIHPMINATKDYSQKVLYDFSNIFLKNYNYYDENKSSTFSLKICQKRRPYEDITDKPLAEQMCVSNETILLYENIEIKNKIEEKDMYFELVRNTRDNIPGVIGLGYLDSNYQVSFLSRLKNRNLIKNYVWFYDFSSWDSSTGKVVIGSYPHEIYEDKYSENDILYTKNGEAKFIFWDIIFDEIYVKNKKDYNVTHQYAELDLESNLIVAPSEYRKYLLSLLNELINNNKCTADSFKGYNEIYDYLQNYTYFYCKNEKDTKNKLYELITPIYFFSRDLNYTFELTTDQILREKGDYIYFNIVFDSYKWILGKQIALKYQFIFNPDGRTIGFYPKLKDPEEKKSSYLALKIIGIIILAIILVVLGVILGKYLYGIHKKKRANELNDDYEYCPEENKNKDNKIINEDNE